MSFLPVNIGEIAFAEQQDIFPHVSYIPTVLLLVFVALFVLALVEKFFGSNYLIELVPIPLVLLVLVETPPPSRIDYLTYMSADKEIIDSLKIEHQGNCVFTVLNESESPTTLRFHREENKQYEQALIYGIAENQLKDSERKEHYMKVNGDFEKKVKILPKEKITLDAKTVGWESEGKIHDQRGFSTCHSLLKGE